MDPDQQRPSQRHQSQRPSQSQNQNQNQSQSPSQNQGHDVIQLNLDAVTRRLIRPTFLTTLTPSRLPSQAASDASLSPTQSPSKSKSHSHSHSHSQPQNQIHTQQHRPSHLHKISVTFEDVLEQADLVAPLIQEPLADGGAPALEKRVRDTLEAQFLGARTAFSSHPKSIMAASDRNFQTFAHGHHDLVLAVDFNYFGTRMVTASSDHRLKVWDKKDDAWSLVESWKAHDAEIVDVKWNGPFMGEVIGSIGEDGRCKLWQEDVTEVPQSGNRFKLITNMGSQTNAPFVSMDFKNIMQETWLALITRDGLLLVYEPVDQSSLNEWSELAHRWVCSDNPPGRHEEVGFKVAFHKEKLPCWTAIMAGLDRKSLGLAVAAMNKVFVFRTDRSKRFWLVTELLGARQIIRDIAWANGSMRGYDVIATASKDGAIRIYELSTVRSDKAAAGPSSTSADVTSLSSTARHASNQPSGIGKGLASTSKVADPAQDNEQSPGRVRQQAKLVDELTNHHGAVWRLAFSQMGMRDLLVSTGDDASIRTWKKAVNGHWAEYAEIETAREN
ncbi:WD40 repeat-like protein [Periconia macrospinosa]|uniref:WD40 repeat-like protein n=1 Tax=Periconia macrospinosa TaxID=97972 RepID=A0A2V1D8S3_9PLEO|nr:WD40 repeat-like protein [Periconia macrospinosa]